ncbi:hypothetical protein Daus18300_002702 [Diaporthe australafricana]|uniref:2EXR domain-containing protein n=1 Tax=Diaporthe australafricana TaxID=127596 RepID=A0ABR3XKG2_9PEZI
MAQVENDTFVRFMYLPAEIREMVWREAWSHRKPEVCTHLNTESPTEGLHGFPPTQLIVDIDLVLVHACHDSRAFLTSKAGGVRFRYSRFAKCNVPCRAFDPTLDTLYLGWHNWDEVFWKSEHLGRHSNCDADVLKTLPDNKHAE